MGELKGQQCTAETGGERPWAQRVAGQEARLSPPSTLGQIFWGWVAGEDPERRPEASLQAAAPPPLPLGCLTSLPPLQPESRAEGRRIG